MGIESLGILLMLFFTICTDITTAYRNTENRLEEQHSKPKNETECIGNECLVPMCKNCLVPGGVVCFKDSECPGEKLCISRGNCKTKPVCYKEHHFCACPDGLSWNGRHCDCEYPRYWDRHVSECRTRSGGGSGKSWIGHLGEVFGLVFFGVLAYLFYKMIYLPRRRRRNRGRDRNRMSIQPAGNPGLMKSFQGNPPPAPQPGYMTPQPGYMTPQQYPSQGGASPYPPPYEAQPAPPTLIPGVPPPPYTPPDYTNLPRPGPENFQAYYYYQPPGETECKYQAAYPPL